VITCETAKTYSTLVGGRVLEGIAIAAYESLAVASIGGAFWSVALFEDDADVLQICSSCMSVDHEWHS
jgi:hypothetical protein